MEAATATFIGSSIGICRPAKSVARSGFLATIGQDFVRFPHKHYSSVSYSKPGHRRVAYGSRRCMGVRASLSSSSDSSRSIASIAPLQLESPVGQFLSQILISRNKSVCIRSSKMESTSHCVLVLIWYRIDLLLFVPTNRIVTF